MANNKQHRTSLKDLARELGVSIATVSRALRSSPEIGKEMQQRVKELAKKLNYRPNPFAQSLRKEAPKMIGVVMPNLVTHYYAAVLDGIEDEARKAGYSVISANSHERVEDEAMAVDNFIGLHVEGIIACLAQTTRDYHHFEEIAEMGIPLVFFGRTCLTERFSSVTANGDEAAYMATQHLIETGSRKIAFVGGPNHLDMVVRRKHGYLEALRDNKIAIDRNLVVCDKIDYQTALSNTEQLLDSDHRPDAILAFNDIITFAAFTAIKNCGLRIPQDVALIGFTDDVHANYVTPRLSAIEDQSHQMGVRACQLLLKNIQGDTKVYKEKVPQRLVIRETSSKSLLKKMLMVLAFLLMIPMAIQAAIPDMKFRRLDTRNGLSNSQVNCTFRDSKGYVWIGTMYGLNRYDGYRVKTYYANTRDTTTMRDNNTSEIMESFDGKLWLHQGMHYSIYDPVTEKFERNTSKELEKYFGFNKGVEQLYIDAKKNFWVKFYDEGLYYYNPNTKKITHFNLGYGDNELNPTYNFTAYSTCDDGVMMVTSNGELVCFDGEKGKKMYDDKWMRDHGSPENKEYHLCVDNDRNIWVSAENNTYVRVDKDGQWRIGYSTLFREYQIENVPDDLQVWDLKVDAKGHIWLATDHEGLLIFDLKNHEMRQFLNNKFDESSLSENTLRYIYMDPQGLVWIGTYKNGVNMYKEASASMMNLELGDINAVSEDRFGNYWLGSNDRGIFVYNPKTQETVAHYTKENSPMFGNIMVGTYTASDGSVWFGGYNSGLTRCIPKNDNGGATIINYHYTGEPGGIATDNVWSVTEDKWHRIWIGTLGSGIQMLDLKTGKFRTWDTSNTKINANYVTSAFWIKKGWLMMGTSWYWCFVNPVTGQLCPREIPDYERFPSQSGNTVSVIEDSRGIIWQGSFCGVLAFDQKRKTVRLIDMQDGLFGSSVCSILEDQQHNIWIVTDHGVSKVVPQLQEDGTWQFNISSYNNRDGLQQAVYNQRSTCLTHDGKILIGGQGGLDIINPKAMTDTKSKERPIFSGLQLFDADVPVGREIDGRLILDEALDECREITLNYDDQFTIQLASDAGIVNNGKRFVYRLEGFNENWVRTSELNPNITYNSLRAGSYTLHVRMLNDDGTMGEEEATLDITIRPALWRNRWMMALYMLIIAIAAFLWRKRFLKRHERRVQVETAARDLEQQQWMNDMRMKMANQQENQTAEPEREAITLNPAAGDLVFFIRHLCENYKSPDPEKKAKISFLSAVDELTADFDEAKLTEVFEILFRNSIKFTAHPPVAISVGIARAGNDKAEIQVADNGIGIKDEYKATAFDPIVNDGGIGLDTVKDIVVAHGGSIRLEDNPGGGTIFFITLPVQSEIEVVEAEVIE